MKRMRILTLLIIGAATLTAQVALAQSAEEVIKKYLEVTGGEAKWRTIQSIKATGAFKQGAMDFPFVTLQTATGMQKNTYTFQGKEMVSPAFDGNSGWSTNFMTMKPEKMESEDAENMKRAISEFPDPFVDYAKKGFKATLEGKEKYEGTECFKIKLVKTPILVEGKEEENAATYYFDAENYVPLGTKSVVKKGEAKGGISESVFSDYQEVEGFFMPFSIAQKFNGQEGGAVKVTKYELNVQVDKKDFAFPTN